jgi:hypothetical protein
MGNRLLTKREMSHLEGRTPEEAMCIKQDAKTASLVAKEILDYLQDILEANRDNQGAIPVKLTTVLQAMRKKYLGGGEMRLKSKRIHELKTWPEQFRAVKYLFKTAEFRKNDQDFSIGDELLLREYDPSEREHTGRSINVSVTHIVYGPNFGIPDGYCMMSIQVLESLPTGGK